ncbi:MAG: DUF1214 domain-containing protein [Gammaproteobacteria bacterium]|nr:DUF1214 domain-containing protein [Gammaproteobacteria bacterium]
MSQSEAEKKVIDGSAWDEFCDALKHAGKIIQSPKAPKDAFDQAEGYRYLTRLLRGGLESFLEFRDPEFPQLRCGAHETIKLGADNPDNRYESCSVNPKNDYRLFGTRGTVDYLGIGSVINKYATGGGMKTTGYIDAREMTINDDGSFELIISQREHPGNWLPIGPETNSINVRQTFQDRINEEPAELKIERIGAEGERPAPLTAEKLVRGLQGATMFVQGSAKLFEDWSESFLPTNNQLPPADQAYCQSIGGDPNIFYFHSAWELADDEVLVIEAPTIPECQTWNFQLDNWWMESLDYRHHTIHVNKHTAHYEDDGSVVVYISHTDPGKPNWVETAGHKLGTMCWRWIGADEHPLLNVRVVKFADL